MALAKIPALFMRGGTSKALVFDAKDLPENRADWDAIFVAAMGSPDPNGRQLNGMGGGISSLSKVCVLGPSTRADADVDYTFAQIGVERADVDYAGNCGNMSSAMGPAALELGLLSAPPNGDTTVRIHNTNTGKIIIAHFPVSGGLMASDGDFSIDGVAGTAAPIRLEFLDPGGAKTGKLLPTGSAVDSLSLPTGQTVRVSLVDAANPCAFVSAADLGKSGTERPDQLLADTEFMSKMEAIRCAASVAMGIAEDIEHAASIPSIPKVAIVAEPSDSLSLSGGEVRASQINLSVRMLSMEQPHKAVPITGAICLAAATRVSGSIPNQVAERGNDSITIGHPSGTITVDATVEQQAGEIVARSGTIYRTARMLFSGYVHYRT